MKYTFTLLGFLFILFSSPDVNALENNNYGFTTVVDSSDTIYFDLSNATITGNQVIIPVAIMTNEPVNAVDFSFSYNHSEIDYDTISNLAFYLQGMAYYNPLDSIVRFTSSSLTPVGVATTLLDVKFNLLGTQIDASDFNDVNGYLNGIKCTAVIINQLNVGVSDVIGNFGNIHVYPNPASDQITFQPDFSDDFYITDLQGRIVKEHFRLHSGILNSVDISNFQNGVYLLRSVRKDLKSALKLVVQH